MSIQVINTEKFKSEIFDFENEKEFSFKKDKPIILNFFASWCGPCHAFAPTLEEAAAAHEGKFDVFKIDIDQDPLVPALFGVQSVPTTVFFIPNEEPALTMGRLSKESLDRAIQELFGL